MTLYKRGPLDAFFTHIFHSAHSVARIGLLENYVEKKYDVNLTSSVHDNDLYIHNIMIKLGP
jgi:hypothetical protein